MEETVKQEATEKTFTQDEVNGIVNDRLARERKKYEGIDLNALKEKAARFDEIEEANKSELEKANERANALQAELESIRKANEVRLMREKVAIETGVPANLLSKDTEEACIEQAKAIIEYRDSSSGYPKVKDGGEVSKTMKHSTREQFAEWANEVFS